METWRDYRITAPEAHQHKTWSANVEPNKGVVGDTSSSITLHNGEFARLMTDIST